MAEAGPPHPRQEHLPAQGTGREWGPHVGRSSVGIVCLLGGKTFSQKTMFQKECNYHTCTVAIFQQILHEEAVGSSGLSAQFCAQWKSLECSFNADVNELGEGIH